MQVSLLLRKFWLQPSSLRLQNRLSLPCEGVLFSPKVTTLLLSLLGFLLWGLRKHLLMEEITKTWNNLSLNEREGLGFTLQSKLRSSEFLIAAKFLTKQVLKIEAVARMFRQLWRSTSGFKIWTLDDHVVMFIFSNQVDVTHIIQSEPWCFDKHLVVLEKFEVDVHVRELQFNKATFQVQVHDILIRFMTREIAENISDIIEEVSRSIGGVDEDSGSFIRVRVRY